MKCKTPNPKCTQGICVKQKESRTGGCISIVFLVELLHYPWVSKMGVMGNI